MRHVGAHARMRLDSATIFAITGRKRPACQVAWFKQHLGAAVPCDSIGPILTAAAYEALVARALGLTHGVSSSNDTERPQVRLRGA
jgi:hypothetical protein